MRHSPSILLSSFLLVSLLSVALCTAEEFGPPLPTADLRELVKTFPPVGTRYRLTPEWIGTTTCTYAHGDQNKVRRDDPYDLRFTQARVGTLHPQKKDVPYLEIYRARKSGGNTSAERSVFRSALPESSKIVNLTATELQDLLGEPHRGIEAWGRGDELNWVQWWNGFTFEAPNRLRIVQVTALVKGDRKQTHVTVKSIEIREGIFHPADPTSAKERKRYKSGEDLTAAEELKGK